MFLVKWQDLSEKVVYRRFTEIYEFHVSALCVCVCVCVWRGGGVRRRHHIQPQLCLRGGKLRSPLPSQSTVKGAFFKKLRWS